MDVQIIETSKGKPCVLYNGYSFCMKKTNKGGSVFWSCTKEKTEKCRGSIIMENNRIIREVDHLCKPSVAATEVKHCIFNAKKRAREDDNYLPMSKIYQDEFQKLYNQGLDFVTEIPKFSSVKSSLNDCRKRAHGLQRDPTTASEIVFPEEIITMSDKTNFLFIDESTPSADRIMVFASSKAKEILSNSKDTVFMDGTFKSCSKQFSQIYTIHIDIGSTSEETNTIPLLFALLPNKTKTTYDILFSSLKEKLPNWKPSLVKLDFELAMISALEDHFPEAQISGCNFHFNQCIWKNIQNIGLVSEYKDNEEIRLHIRMCAALAYLPVEDIDDGWLCIQETSPMSEKMEQFYDYFVKQWLENKLITKEMWNCHQQRHRSNNTLEGWNHRLNTLIRPHSNVYQLVKCLLKEAEYSDHIYDRSTLNLKGKRRKKTYITLDERISKTLKKYNDTGDLRLCLKTLAYIQKLE